MNNVLCSCSDSGCLKLATVAFSPKSRTWYNSHCAERVRRKMELARRELADDQYTARLERWPVQ